MQRPRICSSAEGGLLISGPGRAELTVKWVLWTGCQGSLGIPGGGYNRWAERDGPVACRQSTSQIENKSGLKDQDSTKPVEVRGMGQGQRVWV